VLLKVFWSRLVKLHQTVSQTFSELVVLNHNRCDLHLLGESSKPELMQSFEFLFSRHEHVEADQQLERLEKSFRCAIDEAINKASVASKEQLVFLKDDMLREVSGLKEEVAKQNSSQAKFQETLDAIAERTLSLGLQLDSLQADIKMALGELVNLGAATNAILVSNESLGKAFESVRESVTDMLKEDAESIKGIEAAISNLKNTSISPADLQSMLAPMQERLNALLMNVHEVPTWLCIYPHKSATTKEKLNPFNLAKNKYDAQCMCEWTHRLSSKVMQFTQPKAWVRINYLSFIFSLSNLKLSP
jgi:hypothetical protein